jgi:hypothetical protein
MPCRASASRCRVQVTSNVRPHKVKRAIRWSVYLLLSVCGAIALAIAFYDLVAFQPYRSEINKLVACAEPAEKSPPELLKRVLRAAHGESLSPLVARQLLFELKPSRSIGGMLGWHGTNILWSGLVQIHLSNSEQTTLFMSLSYMGENPRGFALAAPRIVGVPLADVSLEQAAVLVTVAKAPQSYLSNPERLRKGVERTLTRLANAA